jgi:hypothetical protein
MTDHAARPESWDEQRRWTDQIADSDCIMELLSRVERLEQAQQQAEPSTEALQRELVRSVAEAIGQDGDAIMWKPEARRAILVVTDWLVRCEFIGAASALRREVGR